MFSFILDNVWVQTSLMMWANGIATPVKAHDIDFQFEFKIHEVGCLRIKLKAYVMIFNSLVI